MRIKRLLAIGLSIGIIAGMLLSASGVLASPISRSKTAPPIFKSLRLLIITIQSKSAQTLYRLVLQQHLLHLKWYSPIGVDILGMPQLGLTMAVPANALAVGGFDSSSTATSVTASNSYLDISYSELMLIHPLIKQVG